jgi:hypothetical protein
MVGGFLEVKGWAHMTYKLICPSCDRYTSALFQAYAEGYPCPYCGSGLAAASSQYYRQLPDDHRMPPTNLVR